MYRDKPEGPKRKFIIWEYCAGYSKQWKIAQTVSPKYDNGGSNIPRFDHL